MLEHAPAAVPQKRPKAWIEKKSYKMGVIMNALRLALVGEGKRPGMFYIVCLLGKEETLQRLRKAIITLG